MGVGEPEAEGGRGWHAGGGGTDVGYEAWREAEG